MTPENADRLQDDLRAYGWERARQKMSDETRNALKDAVDAWLNGSASASSAAESVRAIVPVDPSTLPLAPRSAKIVDGRLFRKSGRRWVAADGTILPMQQSDSSASE